MIRGPGAAKTPSPQFCPAEVKPTARLHLQPKPQPKGISYPINTKNSGTRGRRTLIRREEIVVDGASFESLQADLSLYSRRTASFKKQEAGRRHFVSCLREPVPYGS